MRHRQNLRRFRLETLELRLALTSDWGDAPAPFPTLSADDGAVHEAVGPELGLLRDTEDDGLPTANGVGHEDDDGVSFGMMRPGQLAATMTVSVTNATQDGAFVNAWIDFNHDGSWSGADEHVANRALVHNGDNAITFDVPAHAIVERPLSARVRLSTQAALGHGGPAPDGEVEDYQIMVTASVPALGNFAPAEAFPINLFPSFVHPADVDEDGDFDYVVGVSNRLLWFENDGGQLLEHEIEVPIPTGLRDPHVVDIDGDSDRDILFASIFDDAMLVLRNNGNQEFFTESVAEIPRVEGFRIADLDNDGDSDIVTYTSSLVEDQYWLENDGAGDFARHLLINGRFDVEDIEVQDLDRDGEIDILFTQGFRGIAWLRNTGAGFEEINIDVDADTLSLIDYDLDDDYDLLYSENFDGLSLQENLGEGEWGTPVVLDERGWSEIEVGDVNGDRYPDIVGRSNRLSVLINSRTGGFLPTTVVDSFNTFHGLADIDRDGRLDFVSDSSSREISVYSQDRQELDFGDAPAPYPSRFAHGGVIHIAAGPSLGELRTSESDALLDDGDDGITVEPLMVREFDASFIADTPQAGFLNAWIDFDGDGAWDQNDEWIVRDRLMGMDENTVMFDVPQTAQPGEVYARYRLTSEPMGNFNHLSMDGEVEDYQITINPLAPVDIDYGNAPTSFGTLVTDDGASHTATGPILGTLREAEADGQPQANNVADNDGVQFGSTFPGQKSVQVTVDVMDASPDGAKIDAWVDFNNNGMWDGATEQIFRSLPVNNGSNQLYFDVPLNAQSGNLHARFRLSSAGGLQPLSAANDGEVEDYTIEVAAHSDSTTLFVPRLIADDDFRVYGVMDRDRDGNQEVLVRMGANLVSREYDPVDGFAAQITVASSINFSLQTALEDIDNDNDLDLLITDDPDGVEVLVSDGVQFVSNGFIGDDVSDSVVADFDGDGRLDVAALTQRSEELFIHFQASFGTFEPRQIATEVDRFAMADWDSDGDWDLAVDGEDGDIWYSNDGSGRLSKAGTLPSTPSLVIDFDRDGDQDFLVTTLNDIRVYENDGQQNFSLSLDHDTPNFIIGLHAADFDADGDLDLIGNGAFGDPGYWFENVDGSLVTWPLPAGTEILDLTDLDQDGDVDVLAHIGDEELVWLENSEIPFPHVVSVDVNTGWIDPPDLNGVPQPTSWQGQSSSIKNIEIEFNEEVVVSPDDFLLTNLGRHPDDDDLEVAITPSQLEVSGNIVSIKFEESRLPVLPDGVYSLQVLPTAMNVSGTQFDGDRDNRPGGIFELLGTRENGLYKLTGNMNEDLGVTIFDFAPLAYWFGASVQPEDGSAAAGQAPRYLDLNGDGGITIFDLGVFAGFFGDTIEFERPVARPRVNEFVGDGDVNEAGHPLGRGVDVVMETWATAARRRSHLSNSRLPDRSRPLLESLLELRGEDGEDLV